MRSELEFSDYYDECVLEVLESGADESLRSGIFDVLAEEARATDRSVHNLTEIMELFEEAAWWHGGAA